MHGRKNIKKMPKVFSKIKVLMNSIHFGKGVIKCRTVYGSQAYRAQDSTYFNPFKSKDSVIQGVHLYQRFRIRVLTLCRLKEIALTCGR